MRKHRAFFRKQVRTVGAERFALRDVFVIQPVRESDDSDLDLRDRGILRGELVEEIPHLPDAPEEINRSGPRCRQRGADDLDFSAELLQRRRELRSMPIATPIAPETPIAGAAHDHVADDGSYLLVVGGENVGLFERKLGLIKEVDAGGRPFERRNHVPSSLEELASAM